MATNPLLALISPALTQVLNDVKAAADSVAATPTLENANAELAKLSVDMLNPTHLTGVSLAGAAQELSNLIASFQANLTTATAAPSAAAVAS